MVLKITIKATVNCISTIRNYNTLPYQMFCTDLPLDGDYSPTIVRIGRNKLQNAVFLWRSLLLDFIRAYVNTKRLLICLKRWILTETKRMKNLFEWKRKRAIIADKLNKKREREQPGNSNKYFFINNFDVIAFNSRAT